MLTTLEVQEKEQHFKILQKMGKPVLYCALFSPPARACMITAKLIGLDLDLKFLDLISKKEHLSEEFIKLNPQHTIPVLVDENESIWDSHAIMTYMVSKFAKDDSLYPKDLIKRARGDQRMHFENGVLFQVIKDFVNRYVHDGETEVNPKSIEMAHNSYNFLEKFLIDDYFVGDSLTATNISVHTTLITLRKLVPIDANKYPRLTAWLKRMESLPDNQEVNEAGADVMCKRIRSVMEQNKKAASN